MARYHGPKLKLERREKASLFGSEKWKRRPSAPGQHGDSRKRMSPYAMQFREKQKVKRMYGLMEKQCKNLYKHALKHPGNTGERLLVLLELRLDNILYRMGLAKNRFQSRQFVNHGHVRVNGKKVDIPSYSCSIGDTVELVDKISKADWFKMLKSEIPKNKEYTWIQNTANGGEVKSEPLRNDIDRSINEQLIVELYSR